jgi:hypothetical protein
MARPASNASHTALWSRKACPSWRRPASMPRWTCGRGAAAYPRRKGRGCGREAGAGAAHKGVERGPGAPEARVGPAAARPFPSRPAERPAHDRGATPRAPPPRRRAARDKPPCTPGATLSRWPPARPAVTPPERARRPSTPAARRARPPRAAATRRRSRRRAAAGRRPRAPSYTRPRSPPGRPQAWPGPRAPWRGPGCVCVGGARAGRGRGACCAAAAAAAASAGAVLGMASAEQRPAGAPAAAAGRRPPR